MLYLQLAAALKYCWGASGNLQFRYCAPDGGIQVGDIVERFYSSLNYIYTGPDAHLLDLSGRETLYCNERWRIRRAGRRYTPSVIVQAPLPFTSPVKIDEFGAGTFPENELCRFAAPGTGGQYWRSDEHWPLIQDFYNAC